MNTDQRDQLLRPKFGGPLEPIPDPGPVEVVILAGTDKIGTVELVSFTGLTDGQLRAAPLEVTVLTMPEIAIPPLAFPATLAVTGPLTDAELRAAPVPVASGGLTDAELRAAEVPVSGTFWQGTQPVSIAALPALPTGANTIGTVNIAGSAAVTGTFWQATQPVSAATLPLPTGAATSVKQPAFGTAGTSSADVLSVQGVTNGNPQRVEFRERETWVWTIPSIAAGTNKAYLELFNGAGSGKVLKVLGIFPIVDADTAVTGVLGIELNVTRVRTATAQSTGSAWTTSGDWGPTVGGALPLDTANAPMPGTITGFYWPTGTAPATFGTDIGVVATAWIPGEESSNSTAYLFQGQTNILGLLTGDERQQLTLRVAEGMKIRQGAVASAGSLGFRIVFTIQ